MIISLDYLDLSVANEYVVTSHYQPRLSCITNVALCRSANQIAVFTSKQYSDNHNFKFGASFGRFKLVYIHVKNLLQANHGGIKGKLPTDEPLEQSQPDPNKEARKEDTDTEEDDPDKPDEDVEVLNKSDGEDEVWQVISLLL